MRLGGNFSSQYRYWSSHAAFCATPSFIWAYVAGFNTTASIVGMLAGIACFIGIYACISSRSWFRLRVRDSLFGRAAHIGAKIRSAIALVGLLAFPLHFPPFVWATFIDLYCGAIATSIVETAVGQTLSPRNIGSFGRQFLFAFSTTMVDGCVLSLSLFATVFICLLLIATLRSRREIG